MALLTLSEGNSLITETVFENRLRLAELNRMGQTFASEQCDRPGVPILSGAPVVATDLRASSVKAALAAKGKTTIHGLHHLIGATINWRQVFSGS